MPGGYKQINGSDGKQFSSEYQPENRRKPSLTKMLEKRLYDDNQFLTLKNVELLDDNGVPTGQRVDIRAKLTNAESLMMLYFKKATKSERILIDAIDRFCGKPSQSFEIALSEETINSIPPIAWVSKVPKDIESEI